MGFPHSQCVGRKESILRLKDSEFGKDLGNIMESHKQGQTVQIEMERLKEEPSAEPVPPQSSSCLKRGIVLVSLVSLVTITSTCLLFLFVFAPACVQKDMQPTASYCTVGKVQFTFWLQETRQHYEIFQAKKECKYLIHGWLRQSTNDHSGDVQLVHRHDSVNRTLQNQSSGSVLFFGTEVQLFNHSSIHLHCPTRLTDGFFYIHELSEVCSGD